MATDIPYAQIATKAANVGRQRAGDDVVAGNIYDKYHTRHVLARYLMNGFIQAFDSLFHLRPGDSILEIGCGEGYLLRYMRHRFPDATAAGLDISFGIVQVATRTGCPGVPFLQASAYELPWKNESWDVVVACEVLEHLEKPESALAEMRRVCRRGCLVSVPREPFWRLANMARLKYLRCLGNTPGHVQHWGRRSFVRLVDRFFSVTAMKTPFPWTMIWGDK